MGNELIDPSNPAHSHALSRLSSDLIVWLTTVRPDGRPHTVPVWFYWDGTHVYVFSNPDRKIRNLAENPSVTLSLDNTGNGLDVVIMEGRAEVLEDDSINSNHPPYLEKYRDWLPNFGLSPETMLQTMTEPIRITPTKVRAWRIPG